MPYPSILYPSTVKLRVHTGTLVHYEQTVRDRVVMPCRQLRLGVLERHRLLRQRAVQLLDFYRGVLGVGSELARLLFGPD